MKEKDLRILEKIAKSIGEIGEAIEGIEDALDRLARAVDRLIEEIWRIRGAEEKEITKRRTSHAVRYSEVKMSLTEELRELRRELLDTFAQMIRSCDP